MSDLFLLMALVSIVCVMIGLVRPQSFAFIPFWKRKNFIPNRVHTTFLFLFSFISSVILFNLWLSLFPRSSNEQSRQALVQEKPRTWTQVFSLKGSGSKKSAVFQLTGAPARAKYKFTAGDFGLFSYYIVPEGQDVMRTGGIPEVMTQQSEESESSIHKPAGSYYLNMNSSGGTWTIVIEEAS